MQSREELLKYKHDWYMRNRERHLKKCAVYYQTNKEKMDAYYKEFHKVYDKEQPEINRLKYANYRKNHPDKRKAHKRAYYRKLRDKHCSKCNATNDLHFHHTNYDLDKGITLCRMCHREVHRFNNPINQKMTVQPH